MIRTGSGDRRRIVLVRLLHLFFERRQARCLGSHAPKKKKKGNGGDVGQSQTPAMWGVLARAYLDFFRFWNWEGLDKIFDLFSLYHEVVHELLLVCCSVRVE